MSIVETYEVEETTYPEQESVDEESINLIQELDLAGQEELITSKTDDTKSILPYREMTKEEAFIFSTICPEHTKVSNFSSEPIPLRVLQVISHSRSHNYFDEIDVWHSPPATVKDPVLVGKVKKDYNYKYYILARWGAELAPMQELADKALSIWRKTTKQELKKIQNKVSAELNEIEDAFISDALKKHDYYFNNYAYSVGTF